MNNDRPNNMLNNRNLSRKFMLPVTLGGFLILVCLLVGLYVIKANNTREAGLSTAKAIATQIKTIRQIAEMIGTIQVDTREAIKAMQRGNKEVEEGIDLADRAGAALNRIVEGVQQVVDVVNQIAAASEEQSTTSEDISRSVEAISTVSSEAALGIAHISQTANKLRRETDALRQLVSQFKMADGGAESPPLPPREDRAPEPHAVAAPTPSDSIWT